MVGIGVAVTPDDPLVELLRQLDKLSQIRLEGSYGPSAPRATFGRAPPDIELRVGQPTRVPASLADVADAVTQPLFLGRQARIADQRHPESIRHIAFMQAPGLVNAHVNRSSGCERSCTRPMMRVARPDAPAYSEHVDGAERTSRSRQAEPPSTQAGEVSSTSEKCGRSQTRTCGHQELFTSVSHSCTAASCGGSLRNRRSERSCSFWAIDTPREVMTEGAPFTLRDGQMPRRPVGARCTPR